MYRIFIPLSLVFISCLTHAQNNDPEWPCIQVLVPEIAMGVVWPQVIDESLLGTWREDKQISAVVTKLSDLDEFTENEREIIADFNATLSDESRTATLNRVADGIVTLSNERRSMFIGGIKRYTRQQIAIADQIEETLNQLATMEGKSDSESTVVRTEIEETLHWHQRVYDQREHAMQSLCERPVELEEKLSDVLRELAQYLP